jgi:hypothetical protein
MKDPNDMTFGELESFCKEIKNESDEVLYKVLSNLSFFNQCNFVAILGKLGRKLYV